jgi:hypothetical protein
VVSFGISRVEYSLSVTRESVNCNGDFQGLSCTKFEEGT